MFNLTYSHLAAQNEDVKAIYDLHEKTSKLIKKELTNKLDENSYSKNANAYAQYEVGVKTSEDIFKTLKETTATKEAELRSKYSHEINPANVSIGDSRAIVEHINTLSSEQAIELLQSNPEARAGMERFANIFGKGSFPDAFDYLEDSFQKLYEEELVPLDAIIKALPDLEESFEYNLGQQFKQHGNNMDIYGAKEALESQRAYES